MDGVQLRRQLEYLELRDHLSISLSCVAWRTQMKTLFTTLLGIFLLACSLRALPSRNLRHRDSIPLPTKIH